jgi:hypothetical protein
MKVVLKGKELELVAPPSHTVRWEIWLCSATSKTRAFLAALGVSIPAKQWPVRDAKTKRELRPSYDGNPVTFGQVVSDQLVAEGYTMKDLLTAGAVAFALISEGLITQEEVEESAAGFPPAPDGEPTA